MSCFINIAIFCFINIAIRTIFKFRKTKQDATPAGNSNKPRFFTISVLPTWDYKYRQTFECNNTMYSLDTVYSCLQFLPSGWPCFTNCTILHKIGITLGFIMIFLSAYMVLCVGLSNLMNFFRRRGKYSY